MSKSIKAQVREIVEEAFAYLGYMPASQPEVTEAIEHAFDALGEHVAECAGAHGRNRDGRCPRCGGAVRVVGFESCDCGREQIEQLVPKPLNDIRDREWGVP